MARTAGSRSSMAFTRAVRTVPGARAFTRTP